jgi:hypothetical protein
MSQFLILEGGSHLQPRRGAGRNVRPLPLGPNPRIWDGPLLACLGPDRTYFAAVSADHRTQIRPPAEWRRSVKLAVWPPGTRPNGHASRIACTRTSDWTSGQWKV